MGQHVIIIFILSSIYWKLVHPHQEELMHPHRGELVINFITWPDNPPYHISEELKENSRKANGITFDLLYRLVKKCSFDYDITVKVRKISHLQLITFLQRTTTEELRNQLKLKWNISAKSLVVISATSYFNLADNTKLFFRERITKTNHVLVVKNIDALFLMKLFSGVVKSAGVIYFAFLLTILVAFVLWLSEFGSNGGLFAKSFGCGLWQAFCYVAISMTTLGYATTVPRCWLSRLVVMLWLLLSLTITAMISASVINEAMSTVSTDGYKIAVLNHSAQQPSVKSLLRAKAVPYNSYEEIFSAVYNNDVKGALVDYNVAAMYSSSNRMEGLTVQQHYASTGKTWWYKLLPNLTLNDSDECFSKSNQHSYAETLELSYVPAVDVKAYYVRPLHKFLDGSDGGLIKCALIIAVSLVFLGVVVEVVNKIRAPSNEMQCKQKDHVKQLSSKLDNELQMFLNAVFDKELREV